MPTPHGFDFAGRADGTVAVSHHRAVVTLLRGERAKRFLDELQAGDPQQVMARWTGNYRHGNERTARNHPRNSGR